MQYRDVFKRAEEQKKQNAGKPTGTASAALFTADAGKLLNDARKGITNTSPATEKLPNQMDQIDPGRPGGTAKSTFTDLRDKDKGGGGYTPSYASFTPSASYYKAMESANQLLSQLSSGRTSYTDKVNDLMNQIANRPKFQYDMDTDSLFQNSLQSAMVSGQTAMQDTMGQAAALTGGYGSTYATSAANQAYNSFIQDAYANLPDYYNMALDAYNMEGQNMYNQLGMYQTADDTEYSRLANAYQANFANANDIYGKEYDNYWTTQNFNQSERQYAANMAQKAKDSKQSQANWEAEYLLKLADAGKNNEPTYKDPSETQMKKALEAYNTGGQTALEQYVDSLPEDIDIDSIAQYIKDYGRLPYSQRDWAKTGKDTINWMWGLDNNDKVKDQYGEEYRLDDLAKLYAEELGISEEEAKKMLRQYN